MKYLVTGGAGFIGSNIVEELLRKRQAVRVLDNFSTGKRENLAQFSDRIEIIEGDIREYVTVREAVEGVDVILHQAALPSVPRSIADPLTTNEVNVTGTLNVLCAAKDAGVKRVVFASSSSVYGNTPELPKHEGMATNPLSPYAVSKLAAEKYCQVFASLYNMETIVLRYFNVFGPRQDPSSQYSAVIPKFIKAMLDSRRPIIYGDGEQTRDFTFVANVVNANVIASTKSFQPGIILNCACHGQVSLNELVRELNSLMGTTIQPEYIDPRPGDVRHSFADIRRIKETLHFTPSESLEQGLRKTIAWYKNEWYA